MKFLCLVSFRPDAFANVTPEEMRRIDDHTIEKDNRLRQSGHLLFASPLTEPDEAVVIDRRRMKMEVTDGPFAETKEVIGGFMLMEARDIDELTALLEDDPFNAYCSIVIRPLRDNDKHTETGVGRPDLALLQNS